MADQITEIDVCGLSCPEPVLIVMDAMDEHPGDALRVLTDDAHSKENIEKLAKSEQRETTFVKDGAVYIIHIMKKSENRDSRQR